MTDKLAQILESEKARSAVADPGIVPKEDRAAYRALSDSAKARVKQIKAEATRLIQADIFNLLHAERGRVLEDTVRLREKFQVERQKRLHEIRLEVADAERHLSALSPEELRAEALAYMANDGVVEPAVVDALSAALKRDGQTAEHQLVREEAAKRHYLEPWRSSEEGRALDAEDAALAECQKNAGVFPVLLEEDGKRAWVPVSLKDLEED
jgi:ribosomal protein L35